MDLILPVQNENIPGDGKEFTKVSRAVGSTPHRSETNGMAETVVRRIKEGTSAVLWRLGLDEKVWADSMECFCHLRKCPRPPGRWENTL